MKLLFGFCLLTSMIFAQSEEQVIRNIRMQFNTITALEEKGLLQEKTRSYTCDGESTQGVLSYYYKNAALQLIRHTIEQGHHSITYHYYINNDQLFFCFIEEGFDNDQHVYDQTNQNLVAINEDWSVQEKRIYFEKEEPIKCLIKSYGNKDLTKEMEAKEGNSSNHFKNIQVDCDRKEIQNIKNAYRELIKPIQNPCLLEY